MSTTTIYYIVETENLEGKPHILLQWTLPKFSAQYPVEIFVKKSEFSSNKVVNCN